MSGTLPLYIVNIRSSLNIQVNRDLTWEAFPDCLVAISRQTHSDAFLHTPTVIYTLLSPSPEVLSLCVYFLYSNISSLKKGLIRTQNGIQLFQLSRL